MFLLGVICGALGTGIFIKHRFQRFAQRSPREHKDLFIEQLSKELALSNAQRAQAEQIFNSTDDEIRTLLEKSRQQFESLMDQRRVELRKILNAEQQEKLDAFFERINKRKPGPPSPGGPPGGPPGSPPGEHSGGPPESSPAPPPPAP